MDIPLTKDEVEMITNASSKVNLAYSGLFNALAALDAPERDTPADPRLTLVSLQTTKETLSEIRNHIGENPYLTEIQLGDILAVQATYPDDFQRIQAWLRGSSVKALDKQTANGNEAIDISHSSLGRIGAAAGALKCMCTMIEKKCGALSHIKSSTGEGREL